MYIDTNTFWIVAIGLGIAIATVYYSLKAEVKKKADFDTDIYLMIGLLFQSDAIIFKHANKQAQIEGDALYTKNEKELNEAVDRIEQKCKKFHEENQQNSTPTN